VTRSTNQIIWRFLLLLAVIIPPLCVALGDADCEFHMEVRTLAASQETWLRQREDPKAWLVPSWNGSPRVNKPPLTVWINMLAWTGLDPETTPVDTLVHRARLVSAGISLLALFALCGAGTLLHSARLGLLATAVTGTSLLFLRNARLASYDTYLLAFCTLAMAAGIAALQPRSKKPKRLPTLFAWAVCAIALAAAILTKGPIALIMTILPLSVIALTGPRKGASFAGLLGAALLSAAFVLPWYVYVLGRVVAADQIMSTEFHASRSEFQEPWYYLGLIPLVFPWLLWLPAFGVGAARRQYELRQPAIRISIIWFLCIFIAMSIPAAKQQRYIIPILPAVGLLVAIAWQQIATRDKLRWPLGLARVHAGLLTIASLLIGLCGPAQSWLISLGVLDQPFLARLPLWLPSAIAIPLFILSRAIRRANLETAAWLTAIWMAMAATPALYEYAWNENSRNAHRTDIESVAMQVGSAPLAYATTPELPDSKEWPAPSMLLYSRRIIPHWDGTPPARGSFLMAAQQDRLDRDLREAGWILVRHFHDGNLPRNLYRAP